MIRYASFVLIYQCPAVQCTTSFGNGHGPGARSKRSCGVIWYGVEGWRTDLFVCALPALLTLLTHIHLLPSLTPAPTLLRQSVSRGSGGPVPTRTPPTQRAPRHLSQLPAEARPQRQCVNSFAIRLRYTWGLVRQVLAAYLAVSAAWYSMRDNHAPIILAKRRAAKFVRHVIDAETVRVSLIASSINRGARRSGSCQSISRTFLSLRHYEPGDSLGHLLSCSRLRTLFITWTLFTRRIKKEGKKRVKKKNTSPDAQG
ncbi:hypothetical protein EDB84DRAFT_989915 [Lactarius hengduanensis]|nr:hypothetical protein EDB84DRAFT_989915 [Lactarius hengduanensis]